MENSDNTKNNRNNLIAYLKSPSKFSVYDAIKIIKTVMPTIAEFDNISCRNAYKEDLNKIAHKILIISGDDNYNLSECSLEVENKKNRIGEFNNFSYSNNL